MRTRLLLFLTGLSQRFEEIRPVSPRAFAGLLPPPSRDLPVVAREEDRWDLGPTELSGPRVVRIFEERLALLRGFEGLLAG
jgi:hypothetical protein